MPLLTAGGKNPRVNSHRRFINISQACLQNFICACIYVCSKINSVNNEKTTSSENFSVYHIIFQPKKKTSGRPGFLRSDQKYHMCPMLCDQSRIDLLCLSVLGLGAAVRPRHTEVLPASVLGSEVPLV